MKIIHITTKKNWEKIRVSGWLKRPIDLGLPGSANHKDRIFFFLLSDNKYLKHIDVLKPLIAKDKSIGDIGIGVIEYEASDMLAIDLLSESFDPKNIETQYIIERGGLSEIIGDKIEYYSVKEMIPIERLRLVDEN